MKILTPLTIVALMSVASAAHTSTDQDIARAHSHLLSLDLAALTRTHQPEWQVPSAMARSRDEPVLVHRPLVELDGGYVLAAVYGWRDGAWQPAGWRMTHPSIARERSEENVLRNASEPPRTTFSVISASDDASRGINYCTDAPDTHEPEDTLGSVVGDTRTIAWTNSSQGPQGCAYETEFEVQPLDGGSVDWVIKHFRFTLVRGDGDGDGPGEDPK